MVANGGFSHERAIITLAPVHHIFGGVVYQETDEHRSARPDEYYLVGGLLEHWPREFETNSTSRYTILKPVEVVNA